MCSGLNMERPADREQLAKACLTGLRLGLTAETIRNGDLENLVPLVDLLEELMPDERQIAKMNG